MATSKTAQAQEKIDQRAAGPEAAEPQGNTAVATAVATTDPNAGAVTTQDDNDFSGFAGQGFQNLGKDDLAIPFLVILQSNSPQVKRSDGQYVEGAAEGMLFNSVTREVYDPVKEKLLVIPCAYDRNFVEWRIRENGGGFQGVHTVEEGLKLQATCIRDDKNRDILPGKPHQLNDTRTFFVMLYSEVDGAVIGPALISMTSTQIKKQKQWLMQQNLLKLRGPNGVYTPPMYASKWRITTVPESNEKGSWMGWAFTHEGYLKGPKDPAFIECEKFAKSVSTGNVKADYEKAAEAGAAPGQPGGAGDDDNIPF